MKTNKHTHTHERPSLLRFHLISSATDNEDPSSACSHQISGSEEDEDADRLIVLLR